MNVLGTVWSDVLKLHKQWISKLGDVSVNQEKNRLSVAISGEELALSYYEFKCAKCKTEQDLSIHHLISKIYVRLLEEHLFYSQRNYWANLLVLCCKCHDELDGGHKERKGINEKKIVDLKLKFAQKEVK